MMKKKQSRAACHVGSCHFCLLGTPCANGLQRTNKRDSGERVLQAQSQIRLFFMAREQPRGGEKREQKIHFSSFSPL